MRLDEHQTSRRGVAKIVGWSMAAAVSIVCVVLFGVPLAADRLAPLVPKPIERRIGDASEVQVKTIFGRNACEDAAGKAAFIKLVNRLRDAAGLDDDSMTAGVLPTPVPNAFALPGGKVFVLKGLLDKAESPDELAGILAHELGHLKHYDNMRGLIYNGGTSFLIGLLFGDVTGSSAVIFASRSVVEASYSREAETAADTFRHRDHAQARPFAEARGRIDVPHHRQGRRRPHVDPGEPSADRGPPRAHDEGRSPRQRPAAADGYGVAVAEGDLRQREDLERSERSGDRFA